MSFWKNLFGTPKKETQIIEEPEHEITVAPPDDLMIVKDKQTDTSSEALATDEVNISNYKIEDSNNKDSP